VVGSKAISDGYAYNATLAASCKKRAAVTRMMGTVVMFRELGTG